MKVLASIILFATVAAMFSSSGSTPVRHRLADGYSCEIVGDDTKIYSPDDTLVTHYYSDYIGRRHVVEYSGGAVVSHEVAE